MVGATDLRSSPDKAIEKNLKSSSSDSSFGKALKDKISSGADKEAKGSPRQEVRAKDSKESDSRKEDKAQKTDDRAEQKVAKPDGIKKKAANRQLAIKEFMDSFESEFEIPPTRLVEAMAQLDDSQLKESPEATADAVVDKLGIDDAQADKARAMYVALLTQLQQTPQAPKAPPEMTAGIGMSSQQNMQMRVAAAQEKQDLLGNSLESLNKKFWMRQDTPAAQTTMPTLDGDLMQRMTMDDSQSDIDMTGEGLEAGPFENGQMNIPEKMPELPPHLQGQMKDVMSPALLAALAAKKAAAAQAAAAGAETSEEAPELSEEFMQALEGPQTEKPLQGPQMNNVQGKALAQDFSQQQNEGQSLMQHSKGSMQQGMGQSLGDGKESAKDKLTTKSAEFKSAMTGMEGLHAQPLKGEALKFDPMMPMAPVAPGQATGEKSEVAVKQLMNQAQYLIKNGGGEVKVEMTPEGMGTIHLKVMLQDGKVNLQMSADTPEAKKTIESSLAELKTSLAAHKLSMENVKVDVVNSTSTDTATQNQPNMNGQGQQQKETRQFWNQFNDNFGNQGRRESFGEFQNIKGYGGKSRDPLQPIDTGAKTASRAVEGKGRGLNLVA